MTTEYEMRLLAEMAEEIEERGCCALPGSLRSFIKGKRASRVAALLESQAHEILHLREEIDGPIAQETARLKAEINGLRDSMHEMSTDLAGRLKL